MDNNIQEKQIIYKESDIRQILQLLDSLVVQGLNNMQIVSQVGQILITKRVTEDESPMQ